MARLDDDIDHLYKVPLGEFTAERNALAKRAGTQAAEIRALQKPTVAAWAINQLYWEERPVYDELIERAEDLRATHNAAVRGRRTDLRGASKAHEEALETALKATLALLAAHGQPVTDATRQAIATTLRSLPGDEPAGRLSRQLQPRGFEMLAGAPGQSRGKPAPPPPKPKLHKLTERPGEQDARAAARIAAAREAVTLAARGIREAEQLVRREEFEAARANRELEKAERRVRDAEEAVKQAKTELDDAKRAAAVLVKARDIARTRAEKATDQLAHAREREQRARSDLESMS